MSTPPAGAPPPGGLDHAARIVSLAVSVTALGLLVWIAMGRPLIRLVLLRGLMAGAQNSARALGGLGLAAENAYRAALESDTLA